MILLEDKIIGTDATQIFEESLKAVAERHKGDGPANLVLTFEGGESHEANFAGLRFDSKSKQLMPLVQVGRWENLLLVMGIRKWLIFKARPLTPLGGLDLYRNQNDDTGFYKVIFHVHKALLIAIYEGGVAAISATGEVTWHQSKHWDDELLEVDQGRLIFLAETGARFALDCDSGKKVSEL